ncbi:MAG: tetratricopeptide repeat protein [Acidobacteria bacterium]|nr:tetratricopeptide repeat protein [Acidobacteriota bacterium]
MRNVIVWALIVAMAVSLQASIFKKLSSSMNLKGEKYLKKAEVLYGDNQFDKAIPLYLKFFEKNKKKENIDVDIFYHVAVCFMEGKKQAQGYAYIETAAAAKPDDLDIQVLKAEYLVALGSVPDAIETYQKIVKTHPDDYLSYIRLGELTVGQGDLKGAREWWEKAIELDPSRPDGYSRMSESYLKVEKNRLEAYYYARKLLDVVKPDKKPGIQRMLDNLAGDMGQDYENYFQKQDCMMNAEELFKNAKFLQAFQVMDKCKTLPNLSGDYFLLFGKVCDEVGKFKDAAFAYERCIALGLESGDICYRLGWSYLNSGQSEQARIAFQRAQQFTDTKEKAKKMLDKLPK